jgi:hypothetical protein
MRTEDLLKKIEQMLNGISLSYEYDIIFTGSNDFVDLDWRRKKFGIPNTPFSLIANDIDRIQGGSIYNFRYSIYMMPFEEDRDKIAVILDTFDNMMANGFKIDDYNYKITPINITTGESFSEGSGYGVLRYEVVYTFNGQATTFYNMNKDLVIKFDNIELPIVSYKWEVGKEGYVNKGINKESDNAINLDNNSIVVECNLSKTNGIIENFMMIKNKINIVKKLELLIGAYKIIDDMYEYKGFTFSGDTTADAMNVFLYFSPEKVYDTLTLNGDSIPILNYGITTKIETKTMDNIESNIYTSFYLGKATSYAFSVSEDEDYQVIKTLREDLMSGEDKLPYYDLSITIEGISYNKKLVLTDITKETNGNSKGAVKLVFLERGELVG